MNLFIIKIYEKWEIHTERMVRYTVLDPIIQLQVEGIKDKGMTI